MIKFYYYDFIFEDLLINRVFIILWLISGKFWVLINL